MTKDEPGRPMSKAEFRALARDAAIKSLPRLVEMMRAGKAKATRIQAARLVKRHMHVVVQAMPAEAARIEQEIDAVLKERGSGQGLNS